METLHMLNGEATRALFIKSGLAGDIGVWNEALISGPVQGEVATDNFWKARAQYIVKSYEGYFEKGPTLQDYEDLTLKEFEVIARAKFYDEVVLWFEHDLFCQVNMIALLSWLHRQDLEPTQIYLICIDKYPGHSHFKGLGELNPEDFQALFPQKIKLTTQDIEFAHEVWLAYADPSPYNIQKLLKKDFPDSFPFLHNALEIHLKRFPSPGNGLNHIQTKMLMLIKQGIKHKMKLVGAMLRDDTQYGFGDVQYFEILYHLKKLYNTNDHQVSLNSDGEKVLSGAGHFLSIEKSDFPLGGANGRKYYWDEQTKALMDSNY